MLTGWRVGRSISGWLRQGSGLLHCWMLGQSAGTLIIDQPEDDLDNRVIMRIVELLRTSKFHGQLIFTTHNANFVVNGDADKIVALKSPEPTSNPNNNAPHAFDLWSRRLDRATCRLPSETPFL
jgi:hypothetical protein